MAKTILSIPVRHVIKDNDIVKNEVLFMLHWDGDLPFDESHNKIFVEVPLKDEMRSLGFVFDLYNETSGVTYMDSADDLQLTGEHLLHEDSLNRQSVQELINKLETAGWHVDIRPMLNQLIDNIEGNVNKEGTRVRFTLNNCCVNFGLFNGMMIWFFYTPSKEAFTQAIQKNTLFLLFLVNVFFYITNDMLAPFALDIFAGVLPFLFHAFALRASSKNRPKKR